MNETYRNIAVVIEIGNAIKYLCKGLGEIRNISDVNDFYDPVLMFLSNGFERLFKTMLCLNFKENNGRLPNYKELLEGQNGHDIEFLKSKVEKICIPINNSIASNDYNLITNDSIINNICNILSKYGSKARYFNFDAILGTEQGFDAKKEWGNIETKLLIEKYGEKEFHDILSKPDLIETLFEKSNTLIISKIEIFVRALVRQFIFGDFSREASQFVFEIELFSSIEDNQIGKTDYRKFNKEWIKKD